MKNRSAQTAFTLLEVMIACGVFFMAVFSILALVSSSLRNARALGQAQVDAGMAAAQVVSLVRSNKNTDVSYSGDFGRSFPDYSWEAESRFYDSNGLVMVNIVVNRSGARDAFDAMSLLVYAPDAKPR